MEEANDMGSIMEENVVSVGAPHRFTSNDIQECIRDVDLNLSYEIRNMILENCQKI